MSEDYIDFHCHVDSEKFSENRDELINSAIENGVKTIVNVADAYCERSHRVSLELEEKYSEIFLMTAAHPHDAKNYNKDCEARIEDFIVNNKIIAVGEAGLDFYYDFSDVSSQENVFRRQLAIASCAKLPILLHSRNAESRVLEIIREEKFCEDVIFHCYTGSYDMAKEIFERGYYISFSGIVTFKKSDELKRIATELAPLKQIFTETDSPYLAPVPYRGKVNQPLYVKEVAGEVARLKNISVEELNRNVNDNFNRVFLKSKRS